MSHDHNHAPRQIRHERPLWWALGLTGTFLLVEVAGAFIARSLALLSDAAHMATDALGLMIALLAVRLARRPPDARRSYGYARLEALGALINGVLLSAVGGYILWEAVERLRSPHPVATAGMFVVAVIGLLINLIAMRLLHAGSSESLNVKGAYLEVWSDMLGSVAVIAGALLIGATGWNWIDPVLALLIGLWVLPRTWVLLREAVNVLLDGVPEGIDLEQVRAAMQEQAGVLDIHDLHVWALASGTPALTAHVLVHEAAAIPDVHARMAGLLHECFAIEHITLQLETRHCGNAPCEQGGAAESQRHAGHGHAHDEHAHEDHDAHGPVH